MRTWPALLSLFLVAWQLSAARSEPAGGPRWLADPDEAIALAAEDGRPLLVVFR